MSLQAGQWKIVSSSVNVIAGALDQSTTWAPSCLMAVTLVVNEGQHTYLRRSDSQLDVSESGISTQSILVSVQRLSPLGRLVAIITA